MRSDFDEIRTLTKRFVLSPQKVAKFVFGVFRYADLSVLGDYKLRKAITVFLSTNLLCFLCLRTDILNSINFGEKPLTG